MKHDHYIQQDKYSGLAHNTILLCCFKKAARNQVPICTTAEDSGQKIPCSVSSASPRAITKHHQYIDI